VLDTDDKPSPLFRRAAGAKLVIASARKGVAKREFSMSMMDVRDRASVISGVYDLEDGLKNALKMLVDFLAQKDEHSSPDDSTRVTEEVVLLR